MPRDFIPCARLLRIVLLASAFALADPAMRAVAASDLFVPRQFQTIQAAIHAAKPFDRILVAPGRYVEQIRFLGAPVLVESLEGAAHTTIDGGGVGPVVTFHALDTRQTLLIGFTITGGRIDTDHAIGAGIYNPGGSPTIAENIIIDNRATGSLSCQGAGIYSSGDALILNNTIEANLGEATERGTTFGGAGVFMVGGFCLGNEITGNSLFSGRPIYDKVHRAVGAGAWITSNCVFMSNRVYGNEACFFGRDAFGGGVAVDDTATIALNVIRNNTARAVNGKGGGIYVESRATPTISANLIVENFAQSQNTRRGEGGGIYFDSGSTPIVTYNTICYNRVGGNDGVGAGMAANSATPAITGCIIWRNAFINKQKIVAWRPLWNVGVRDVKLSLVDDATYAGTNGNFDADPDFEDAFRLRPTSPCIDAGEATSPTIVSNNDVDGTARVVDGRGTGSERIDLGAQEFGPLSRTDRRVLGPGDPVGLEMHVPGLGGKGYMCFGSFGQAGIPLPPPDSRIVPLSADALFFASFGQRNAPFLNFTGTLDVNGRASLSHDLSSDPRVRGVSVYFAGVVFDNAGGVTLVTNAVAVEIGGSR